jgi:hypothetical protein
MRGGVFLWLGKKSQGAIRGQETGNLHLMRINLNIVEQVTQ